MAHEFKMSESDFQAQPNHQSTTVWSGPNHLHNITMMLVVLFSSVKAKDP